MKLKGTVNYFFQVDLDVDEVGNIGHPRLSDTFMVRNFMWLFRAIGWLKALAWWNEGLDPMFEITIPHKEKEKYKKAFPLLNK